ncbi:YcxB family protein [Hamadaea sp. NPDC050747]|uniref:YcxB family protein n=1 Tax=Hamadaea sp. NPDC050747 TaxID=3155789 RepID=UPI0033DD8BE8
MTPTETRIRVEFTVPPDCAEQRRAYKIVHRVLFRIFFWFAIGLAALAFADVVLVVALLHRIPIVEPVVLLLLALWGVTFPWRCGSRTLRASPRHFANPVTFEISEVEAGETSAVGHLSVRWAAVTSVVETAEFWVLYADRRPRLVVPRRHLTATDEAAVRQFMIGRNLVPEQTSEA